MSYLDKALRPYRKGAKAAKKLLSTNPSNIIAQAMVQARKSNTRSGSFENLRSLKKDNPVVLELKYNFFDIQLSSGVVAQTGWFSPHLFPGWASLKTLFSEWRLAFAKMGVIPVGGEDQNGLLTNRYTPSATEAVTASIDSEMEVGADAQQLADLGAMEIEMMPRTFESTEYHMITGTDTTEYGYNKEFGQVFLRASDFSGANASIIARGYYHVKIVLRGYKATV